MNLPFNRSPVAPGDILASRYRVMREVGVGAMGVVVQAWHLVLDQPVAVKFLLPEHASNPQGAERFRREARAVARIESEHVARVLDVGTEPESGLPYIVMEFLEGEDLGARLKALGPLPAAEVINYLLQACDALHAAHVHGIVHRDLKPANLFVHHKPHGEQVVKVLDFGISKMPVGGSQLALTDTAMLVGSPAYMSPEQLESSRSVDARADIWALGVSLHQLVAGQLPFPGDSVPQLVRAVLAGRRKPLTEVDPTLAGVEAVVERCLRHDPAERYGSVTELRQALTSALSSLRPQRKPLSRRVARRGSTRHSVITESPRLTARATDTNLVALKPDKATRPLGITPGTGFAELAAVSAARREGGPRRDPAGRVDRGGQGRPSATSSPPASASAKPRARESITGSRGGSSAWSRASANLREGWPNRGLRISVALGACASLTTAVMLWRSQHRSESAPLLPPPPAPLELLLGEPADAHRETPNATSAAAPVDLPPSEPPGSANLDQARSASESPPSPPAPPAEAQRPAALPSPSTGVVLPTAAESQPIDPNNREAAPAPRATGAGPGGPGGPPPQGLVPLGGGVASAATVGASSPAAPAAPSAAPPDSAGATGTKPLEADPAAVAPRAPVRATPAPANGRPRSALPDYGGRK